MNIQQFRSNEGLVAEMAQLFNHPTFLQALITLKDGNPVQDVPIGSPELSSVRELSRMAGYNEAISTLLSLSVPINPPHEEEMPTYGVEEQPPPGFNLNQI